MFNLRFHIHGLLSVGLLLSLLLTTRFAVADQWDDLLQQQLELQSAEIGMIEARLKLDNWNHNRLAGLYDQGFASWFELRRHQLQVDSISVRRNVATRFQSFLYQVQAEKLSRADSSTLMYRQRDVSPVKLFIPGSIRLIGWIEGQAVTGNRDLTKRKSVVDAAVNRLVQAQRRFEETAKIQSSPVAWREKASLDLSLAQKKLRYVQRLMEFEKSTAGAADIGALSIDEVKNFVTAGDYAELDLATSRVVDAENSAAGQVRQLKILLERQQRRAEATGRMQAQGYASKSALKAANDRVASLTTQLNELTDKQKIAATTSTVLYDLPMQSATVVNKSIGSWPDVVFSDMEFAKHLIDLRYQYHDETYRIETARLKSSMLRDLEQRLSQAASNQSPEIANDKFLTTGQTNEIERNRIEIELAGARIAALIEKQQILIHEENRFIQQIIAQHAETAKQTAFARSGFIGPQSLLTLALPTGVVFPSGTFNAIARYSFLESVDLDASGQDGGLVAFRSGQPFLAFRTIDPINRLTRQPAKPVLLGNSNRRYVDTRGLQVGPNATDRLRWSPRQSESNSLPLRGPNLATVNYIGRYGYRSYGTHSAYPNGILRSELRNVPPVGQTPFYLPGWPDNVRVDGYRFGHPDRLYHQW